MGNPLGASSELYTHYDTGQPGTGEFYGGLTSRFREALPEWVPNPLEFFEENTQRISNRKFRRPTSL